MFWVTLFSPQRQCIAHWSLSLRQCSSNTVLTIETVHRVLISIIETALVESWSHNETVLIVLISIIETVFWVTLISPKRQYIAYWSLSLRRRTELRWSHHRDSTSRTDLYHWDSVLVTLFSPLRQYIVYWSLSLRQRSLRADLTMRQYSLYWSLLLRQCSE